MGFVFNPATGDSFSTNPIAATIIQWLKEDKSVADIKKQLLEMYDIDKFTIEKDVDGFIADLKDNNLVND